jgi:hypothetical protein
LVEYFFSARIARSDQLRTLRSSEPFFAGIITTPDNYYLTSANATITVVLSDKPAIGQLGARFSGLSVQWIC